MTLGRLYSVCVSGLRSGSIRLLSRFGVKPRVVRLPYDNTNPVIYDKDEVVNCYTDDYIMALASAGDINLVGIVTSSTMRPYNEHVMPEDYERIVAQRIEGIDHARNSGFGNIPDPVRGPKGNLEKPASGRIEDTWPIDSKGSRLIVNEASKVTPDKPLVVVMGGALTVAADAYLLDNAIADRVVIAWLGGTQSHNDMADYNGWADAWAAYIVLKKLSLVQFPSGQAAPRVRKSRLRELPDTKLRQWMIDKQHSYWKTRDGQLQPGSSDADAPPAISVMRKDYALRAKRVSFSHWSDADHAPPILKDDPEGRSLVVTCACKDVATKEWWRALKNPTAYKALSMN